MLRANLADGSTLSFDLEVEADVRRWRELVEDPAFHRRVRGLQLLRKDAAAATLPRPVLGAAVTWDADLDVRDGRVVRERAVAYAHPVRIVLSLFRRDGPPTSRVDVERVGRLVLPAPRFAR